MGYDWSIIFVKRARWPILFIALFKTVLSREHSGKFQNIAQKILFLKNHLKWSVILSSPSFPNVLHFNKKRKLNLYLRGHKCFAFSALVRAKFSLWMDKITLPVILGRHISNHLAKILNQTGLHLVWLWGGHGASNLCDPHLVFLFWHFVDLCLTAWQVLKKSVRGNTWGR